MWLFSCGAEVWSVHTIKHRSAIFINTLLLLLFLSSIVVMLLLLLTCREWPLQSNVSAIKPHPNQSLISAITAAAAAVENITTI